MSDPKSFYSDKELHRLLKKAKQRVVMHAEDIDNLEKRNKIKMKTMAK